jgi:hypothetical protein
MYVHKEEVVLKPPIVVVVVVVVVEVPQVVLVLQDADCRVHQAVKKVIFAMQDLFVVLEEVVEW